MSWRWMTIGRRWRISLGQEEKVEEKGKYKRRSSRRSLRVGITVSADRPDSEQRQCRLQSCTSLDMSVDGW